MHRQDASNQQAQQALAAARDQAEKASRAKSEFLARMSHELRTPLNAVLGLSQVLRSSSSGFSEHERNHLQTIERAGRHLLALIDDTLDLSRIEAGEMRVARAPVNLLTAVSAARVALDPQATQAGVKWRVAPLAPGMAPWVWGDALRVRHNRLDDLPHCQRVAVFLIDEDVAARDCGAVEMPDEHLFGQRQVREPVGVQLHDGRSLETDFDRIIAYTDFRQGAVNNASPFGDDPLKRSFYARLMEYPELVRKYLGSVVPSSDNFFAALNAAVFTDGSFVYVPKGVRCPMDLSTYFRINQAGTGQFGNLRIETHDDAAILVVVDEDTPIRRGDMPWVVCMGGSGTWAIADASKDISRVAVARGARALE